MRPVLRIVFTAVFVALVAAAWTPAASAFENEAFGVTPFPEQASGSDRSSFSVPLETGATFEDAVRVYNLTDEPLHLALYATDAQAALDDTISVGLREEHPEGVGKWIDLSLKSIELEPRAAKTVAFRVKVRSSDPKPELGAIVVENTDRGLAGNSAQRLHILVRTVPPNTQTSSKRVRTFLVQSPWVAIALLGLVVAGALVWVGARRARRPRDLVVQPGELTAADADDPPDASRPVIRRFGTSAAEGPHAKTSVLDRVRASAGASRRRDDRPLLDDALLVEVDEDPLDTDAPDDTDADEPPEQARSTRAPRQPVAKPAAEPVSNRAAGRKPSPKAKTPARKRRPAAKSTAVRSNAKGSSTKRKASAPAPAKPKPASAKSKAKAKAKTSTPKNFIPLKDL